MTIRNDKEWGDLEQKAQDAERREAESFLPVLPVPEPTVAQQLAFATVRCAELQGRLRRLQSLAAEAHMWLAVGDTQRAQETMNNIILDL